MTQEAPGPRRFSHAMRLHNPEQFESVLRYRGVEADGRGDARARRRQGRGTWFAVSARPNGLSYGRLGIIAARKTVPLAVARNRHKRLIRETFRSLQDALGGVDLVVRVMADAGGLHTRRAAREELVRLMLAMAQ